MEKKLNELNDEELALVELLRKYRAAEAEPLPDRLLEHGYVDAHDAAELLACPVAEIERLEATRELPFVDLETWTPRPSMAPLSEVRRCWQRRRDERLRRLGERIVDLVMGDLPLISFMPPAKGLAVPTVAQRLGLPPDRVEALIEDRSEWSLYAAHGSRKKRDWLVTEEEVEAYARRRCA
jgi:hypothetical protein